MKKTTSKLFVVPYMLWIALFVLAPLVLIFGQSFFNIEGQFSLENYKSYFASQNLTYLKMSFNSVLYAGIVTLVTLLISYPTALFLTRLKHRQLWLMLIILPTWINLLLKAYAFIGIFGQDGSINQFLEFIGIGSQQLLFTDFSFIFVASYIELPFMILPIFNVLDDMDNNLINASYDLGATKWETFRHVIFPLSMNGVRSGVHSVFIPSLSLFMLTRLIGGNRVITLGTAIEQNFLTNDNYGMGSTIGVILTNAKLDKTALTKVTGMAHDGYARVIRPVHTTFDGDSIYAMSSCLVQADINVVGTIAAHVMEKAILKTINFSE